jgi:hypothetical protein
MVGAGGDVSEGTRGSKLRSTTIARRWPPRQRRWYADGRDDENRAERETLRANKSYYCECRMPDPVPIVIMGFTFLNNLECARCGYEMRRVTA